MDKHTGVCIVGCGMMGNIHAQRWHANPRTQVTACADILPERAQAMAAAYHLPAWDGDYRQAIQRPDVDIVSVCTPTCLHAEITLFALAHGKHVLCEKPIALHISDAERMVVAAEQSGRKLGVGFMRRHSPALARLAEWLTPDHLGRPALYHASDIREVRPKLAMHDADQNGGPCLDMAVHLYDTWSAAFGSAVEEVIGRGLTLAAARPEVAGVAHLAPDTAAITARYASGDLGIFVVSWGLPPKVNPGDLPDQVYGPNGLLEVSFGITRQTIRLLKEGGEWETLLDCQEDMYQNEINAFTSWVLDNAPFTATAAAGLAALRAARQGLEFSA